MKQTKLFNRYSLIGLFVIMVLPLVSLVYPERFSNYFDVFEKLSLPLWAGLYGYFWIVFHQQIKKLSRQLAVYQDRIESYRKLNNTTYLRDQIADEEKLQELKQHLTDANLHLDFINIALRITVVVVAIVKLGQFFNDLIKSFL